METQTQAGFFEGGSNSSIELIKAEVQGYSSQPLKDF